MCVNGLLFLLSVGNNRLQNLLVFLQRFYYFLLFHLLAFHLRVNLTAFHQQVALVPTHSCQLVVLLVYLVLLLLQEFALRTLVSCILAYKTETAIHLRERFGREDKHKLVLNAAVARHVAHRVDKTRATLA